MDDPDNWFNKGITLFENHDYPGAITAFEKAISFNQHPVDAWFNRGLVYGEMGKFRQAVESFDETLRLDPEHTQAKTAREMALEKMAKEKAEEKVVYAALNTRRHVPEHSAGSPAAWHTGAAPTRKPVVAALLSFLFPGWGQWYNGQSLEGLFFILASIILGLIHVIVKYLLKTGSTFDIIFLLASLCVGIYGMYQAYTTAGSINQGTTSFTKKSRLFWLPVALYVLLIMLIIFALIMTFMLSGIGAGAKSTVSAKATPGMSARGHDVTATAAQPDTKTIIVTYQGGPDAKSVRQVVVTVTDPTRSSKTKTMGLADSAAPLDPGGQLEFVGNYVGNDHVTATAKFMDGTEQLILDTTL